jgi:hypothetical protein
MCLISIMKPLLAVLTIALLMGGSLDLRAQDAIFIAPEAEDIPVEEAVFERRAEGIQGIVGQILRVFRPLQLINPFAPSYYGTGEQNVSTDESFGQPYPSQPALVVFGVER